MQDLSADRDRMITFRLNGHNLAARSPPGSLLRVAGACGIQNTPPGSAALSLHARVAGLTPDDVRRALELDRTLIQTFCVRGATYVFPTADAAVFTRGVLPVGEADIRAFVIGAGPAFDAVGMSAGEAVRRTSDALSEALDGRILVKNELARELADMIAAGLASRRRKAWASPSWYAPGQLLGEAVVRFCLYVNALEGSFCLVTRRNAAHYVRTDQWLGAPLPDVDTGCARAELVRRYLSCYGPSTPGHFAEWAGISPGQAEASWKLVNDELTDVDIFGRKAWLLRRDVPRFEAPAMPEGARFLPPHDPYLQVRDRTTLIPDRTLHRRIWRAAGNPGIVLSRGRPVALWRPQKKGKRLDIALEMFEPVPQPERDMIVAEAATLAPFKGCGHVGVEVKMDPL